MHLGAAGVIELSISRQSDLNKDFLCPFDWQDQSSLPQHNIVLLLAVRETKGKVVLFVGFQPLLHRSITRA